MGIVRKVLLIGISIYAAVMLFNSVKSKKWGDAVFAVVIICMLIMTRFIGITYIYGPSMQPNLHTGDFILVSRTTNIDRYDIVVVDWEPRRLVKRVIGMAGETIAINEGCTLINDKSTVEPFEYINSSLSMSKDIIPEGYVFVMGDNRPNSLDSRALGSMPVDRAYGRMICKIPFLSKIPVLSRLIESFMKH